MTCSTPIDVARLSDYWLGTLPEAEELTLEEHLLECDDCGDRLRDVIAMADGIRQLAHGGSLRIVVSDAFLERARKRGLQVREYTVPWNGSVACTVSADDDLLIGRLAANLRGAERVDLCWCDDKGVEIDRLADIPVRTGADAVVMQESITIAKAAPASTRIARLVSVDAAGDHLLGEYTFNHTRTIP